MNAKTKQAIKIAVFGLLTLFFLALTVLELLPEKYRKMDIFPCGRLDKNTLGLLILTNNGALAHRLLSPKCHVEKTYRFECERPLTDGDVELLCKGVDIGENPPRCPRRSC